METTSVAQDTTWKQSSNGGKPLISVMMFSNSTNETEYISLTAAQRKEISCIICSLAQLKTNQVFGQNGITCDDNEIVIENIAVNLTEYFVVLPDLLVSEGSLEAVKTILESVEFRLALSASTTLTGVILFNITCSINSEYPQIPLINSPNVSPSENSITFTWTGVNNTNGFIFIGLVQNTNETVVPTTLQLRKNLNYTFESFYKVFYSQNTTISVTLLQANQCMDYTYYWIATNEDPDTYQYTTEIQFGSIKTTGCPTYVNMFSNFIVFILFIFVMLLIQYNK